MLTSPDLIIFFRLLIAHILADFFLQKYAWIIDKRRGITSSHLYYHSAVVGALTYLLLADWSHWELPLFIMVTHFLIDWWKTTKKDNTRYFLLDQLLHMLVLLIGWLGYIGFSLAEIVEWIQTVNTTGFWIVTSSYLLILRPIGFLIGKATASWQKELEKTPSTFQGLPKAGTWIGYMERIIILTFILMSQYSAIGFLIAAKSVFRFSGKVDNEESRKQAEYILIGTLMSFLLAIIVGIGARYFIGY